ncbi:hypothetical protein EB169_09840, partial [archaeon]|nr:hypothetical protein [archaeon]
DESDFKSTLTTGFDRFVREIERAKHFDAFLFIVVEGSVESIIKNNILTSKTKLSFLWHNMRILAHDYANHCQFIFTGQNGKKLFDILDDDFYIEYNELYNKQIQAREDGNDLLAKKISKKLWVIRKNTFEPAYEEYNDAARKRSEEIIPKLLILGKKLWHVDMQYFIDKHELGAG